MWNILDAALTMAAFGGATLLVVSGVIHARDMAAFRSVVVNQGVIPFRHVARATRAFVAIEVVVGLVGSVASTWSFQGAHAPRVVLILVGATYLVMSVYVQRVVRAGKGASCGCFGKGAPATSSTVARAALLGLTPTVLAASAAPA